MLNWVRFYAGAANSAGHGTHSPFVYDFIKNVVNNKKNYTPPQTIEQLRSQFRKDNTNIPMIELGAGSRSGNAQTKTIAQLAETALKPKRWAQLIYRAAAHYKPHTVIELGTSLGITTAYLAAASNRVYTIEGNPYVQQAAAQNFLQSGVDNLSSLTGSFDDVLPQLLPQIKTVDMAYIDGNHRGVPTLNYFHQLLQKKTASSVFIFDDIHWSADMERAWAQIKAHPSVTCSIDLFFLGFVFFRSEIKTVQHFSIRTPFLF